MKKIRPVSAKYPNGLPIISVIASMSYQVLPSGECEPMPERTELYEEPSFYTDIPYKGYIQPTLLKRDIDLYGWKKCTDLVIQGVVRSEKPKKSMAQIIILILS